MTTSSAFAHFQFPAQSSERKDSVMANGLSSRDQKNIPAQAQSNHTSIPQSDGMMKNEGCTSAILSFLNERDSMAKSEIGGVPKKSNKTKKSSSRKTKKTKSLPTLAGKQISINIKISQ